MAEVMVPGVDVRPVAGHIGAEISGVDLSAPLDDAVIGTIQSALRRWEVVFFRGQHLDHAAHLAFARHFGEPITLPSRGTASPAQFPQVEATADRCELAGRYDLDRAEWLERRRYSVLRGWHSDHTAPAASPSGTTAPPFTMLRATSTTSRSPGSCTGSCSPETSP